MKLSKKKRIRQKQINRIQQQAIKGAFETIERAFEMAAKFLAYRRSQIAAQKFPAGGVLVESAMSEFVTAAEKVIGESAVASIMFSSPLNEGKGWFEEAGEIPTDAIAKIMARPTQITIDPDCKTEFTVTSQGFKEFNQQTES